MSGPQLATEPSGDGSSAREPSGYAAEAKPLGHYAVLSAIYNGALATLLIGGRDHLPERFSAADVALMGVATHKLSRLIAKDRVTAFLRAPFTRYEGEGGPAEVSESARGTGVRRAVGELLICPYCLGPWVATAFAGGLVVAPRQTRVVGSIFAAVTISDFLQLAFKGSQQAV